MGHISAWISRAFSGLLIARLLHSVFSWAIRSRPIASLDLISWVQVESELKYAPRYLKECTCLRYTPATVTFIGVKSSSTFITSVVLWCTLVSYSGVLRGYREASPEGPRAGGWGSWGRDSQPLPTN